MTWRDVPEWVMGANDRFGVCSFVACANHVVMLGKGVMSDGEVLNAARMIEGLNDHDPSTDRGQNMEALFNYIQANGWPGDPTLTIRSWEPVSLERLPITIGQQLAAPCWAMLPKTADGAEYDFSDSAVERGAVGEAAHAMCIVEADDQHLVLITWARPVTVSRAWARAYLRQAYSVEWQDIA